MIIEDDDKWLTISGALSSFTNYSYLRTVAVISVKVL